MTGKLPEKRPQMTSAGKTPGVHLSRKKRTSRRSCRFSPDHFTFLFRITMAKRINPLNIKFAIPTFVSKRIGYHDPHIRHAVPHPFLLMYLMRHDKIKGIDTFVSKLLLSYLIDKHLSNIPLLCQFPLQIPQLASAEHYFQLIICQGLTLS